jgi:hypothetical protein
MVLGALLAVSARAQAPPTEPPPPASVYRVVQLQPLSGGAMLAWGRRL